MLDGDHARVVILLELAARHGHVIFEVEGEAHELVAAKGVDVMTMARLDLREYLLGDERRAAGEVDAELRVGLFAARLVEPGDDMRHLVDAAGDFGDHEVGVVVARNGCDDVGLVDARVQKCAFVKADAAHDAAVEVAPEVLERVGVAVDDRNVVAIFG